MHLYLLIAVAVNMALLEMQTGIFSRSQYIVNWIKQQSTQRGKDFRILIDMLMPISSCYINIQLSIAFSTVYKPDELTEILLSPMPHHSIMIIQLIDILMCTLRRMPINAQVSKHQFIMFSIGVLLSKNIPAVWHLISFMGCVSISTYILPLYIPPIHLLSFGYMVIIAVALMG